SGISTIGIWRRCAAIASSSRVAAFSRARSASSWRCQVPASTMGGSALVVMASSDVPGCGLQVKTLPGRRIHRWPAEPAGRPPADQRIASGGALIVQYDALMDRSTADLALAIGARVRQERLSRRWTLD